MNRDYTALPLVHNTKERRFELAVGEHTALLEYRRTPTALLLVHTQVPPALEGQGVAAALIEKTLTYFDQNTLQLVPLCPVVGAYLQRHPEWAHLLAPANVLKKYLHA